MNRKKIIGLAPSKIRECLYEPTKNKYSSAQIRNIQIYIESLIDTTIKYAEEIVVTEMDNLEKTTNAEFIACDDLAIKIINRLKKI